MTWYTREHPNTGETTGELICERCAMQGDAAIVGVTRPDPIKSCSVCDEPVSQRKSHYDEILKMLMNAELASRNGQWMTCGTWAKNAMNRAYEIGNAENAKDKP